MLGVGEKSALAHEPEGLKWLVSPQPPILLYALSHTVCPVVRLGPTQYAVPPLCFLLDLLEEVRGPEDPDPA